MSYGVNVCVGARDHRPHYAETDGHHVFPKYLCALLGVPARRETRRLCSGCHDLAHHVLHHWINEGGPGDHNTPAGIRALVETAWLWWRDTLLAQAPPPR